jgi:hypothetical protein
MDYHSDRFVDHSVMVYREGKLFAVLPANVREDTLYSHQGLTYGSFVLLPSAKLLEVAEAFKGMLHFLNQKGITTLQLRLIPTFYNHMPADELEYLLFRMGAHLLKRDVLMVIDYANQLRFQKNRREGINKARRNGLQVKVDENYDGFWNEVLIPNLASKHGVKPVHSLEEIKLLASRFPDHIKHLSVYNKTGDIVAGTTLFLTKTTVHPQYVSGNTDKNFYGSLDLAYDYAINQMRGERRYFDFNISSEEDGQVLNKGLVFWKETCGARAWRADNYQIATSLYNNLNIELK